MITPDNFVRLSGLIFTVIISISIVTYTNKFILKSGNNKNKIGNYVYDPDYQSNFTQICIFTKNVYTTMYNNTPCYNKTLIQWYNPWFNHYLWQEYWNEVETRRRIREIKLLEKKIKPKVESTIINTTEPTATTTETPYVGKNSAKIEKFKNKSEFMYTLLIGCLVISMLAAVWEVVKDRIKKNEGAGAKAQDKQCSLAEFTINRHLRRESKLQQQGGSPIQRQASVEKTAKVTQNLIHQSSLDRGFSQLSSEVKRIEERRNSVPSYLTNEKISGRSLVTGPTSSPFRNKRQSVDVTGEDSSDMKKKPRHFIRRH